MLAPKAWFLITSVTFMTAGTLLLMWLGDQITERGIGNGMSIIISVGILAQLPAGLIQAWRTFVPSIADAQAAVNPMVLVLMIGFLFFVIAGVIAVTQAQRKISVQYAKRVVGRKVYGGQTQYMPQPHALFLDQSLNQPLVIACSCLRNHQAQPCENHPCDHR